MEISEEIDGCFNSSADDVRRVNKTWSDTNLDEKFEKDSEFERLECRNCKGISFEVLITGSYETSAKCNDCCMYYKVHCG